MPQLRIIGLCVLAIAGIFRVQDRIEPVFVPATKVVCEIPFDEPATIEAGMTIYYHGGDSLTFIRADGSKHTIHGLDCKATTKEQ